MTDLPPLPEPELSDIAVEKADANGICPVIDYYTADQMREYARKAVEAEREAITKAPTYRMLNAISEQFDSDHAMGIGFNPQTLCQAVLKAIRARR